MTRLLFALVIGQTMMLIGPALAGPASQGVLESPRIAALQQELQKQAPGALSAFWDRVKVEGSPVIENADEGSQVVWVTFLWRGDANTGEVRLISTANDIPTQPLEQLAGTDVRYRTVRMKTDTRIAYQISVRARTPPDPVANGEGFRALQGTEAGVTPSINEALLSRILPAPSIGPDPLNPKHWVSRRDDSSPETVLSLLEITGSNPHPEWEWLKGRSDAPAGRIERFDLNSKILTGDRYCWVYTPPGYQAIGQDYGLLVMFEGFRSMNEISPAVVLDNLIAEKRIPPLVAVYLADPPDTTRDQEFVGPSPLAGTRREAFQDFMGMEFLPWIHSKFNVTSDPKRSIIAGVSAGGWASVFSGLRHPELFGNVLSQSGSLFWYPPNLVANEWLAQQFAASEKLPVKFYLDVGLSETEPMLQANRNLRDLLKERGYSVAFAERRGGHDEVSYGNSFSSAIISLIGNR